MEWESIIKRLRALMAKTVENGATESEAMAAAEKVAELMEKYDLSMQDLKEGDPEAACRRGDVEMRLNEKFVWRVVHAISKMTGTEAWMEPGRRPMVYCFFGLNHDVEIAEYLYDICLRAMENESAAFSRSHALLRRNVRERRVSSFLEGMSRRLAKRIQELAWSRRETGKALVPVKDAIIKKEMDNLDLDLKTGRMRSMHLIDCESYDEGQKAGEETQLERGVGTDGAHESVTSRSR